LTPPLFIEVPVPSQESEQSYIFVFGLSIFPLSTTLTFYFGIVPTLWYIYIKASKTWDVYDYVNTISKSKHCINSQSEGYTQAVYTVPEVYIIYCLSTL